MKPFVLALLMALVFTGCAPMVVDLSGSDHLVNRQPQKESRFDYKLVVLNRAPEPKIDMNTFGADTFPMRTAEKPKETLERDINSFFGRITMRVDDKRRIIARIDKAEAYWINPGVNKVPVVGMFTVWASNCTFTFDISVTFEVEENGKVVNSYPFTQKIEVPDGNGSTPGRAEKSYQRLVLTYRKIMFDALELEFLPRYLHEPLIPKTSSIEAP